MCINIYIIGETPLLVSANSFFVGCTVSLALRFVYCGYRNVISQLFALHKFRKYFPCYLFKY